MPITSDLAAHYAHQRKPTRRRWAYASGYLLMAVAGVFAGIWPSPNVSNAAASGYLVFVWDTFLVAGGLCSSVGSVTERWFGEYIGLPLLGTVFAVYGLATFLAPNRVAFAAGAAFLGMAMLLASRWLDVSYARRMARLAIEAHQRSGPASPDTPSSSAGGA
jgi:hypothetical protein